MKRITYFFFGLFIGSVAFGGDMPIRLSKVPKVHHLKESIERGAKYFATHCYACHSLQYLSHDPIANAAGMRKDNMPHLDPTSWQNHPPPDLSLVARSKGGDWVYTFLHSFYKDTTRPTGSNNLVLYQTNMPNPFLGAQGTQVLRMPLEKLKALNQKPYFYQSLTLEHQGHVSVGDFDVITEDLTNFLVYAGEPFYQERVSMGKWVLFLFLIAFVVAYALYASYWKDLQGKRNKN